MPLDLSLPELTPSKANEPEEPEWLKSIKQRRIEGQLGALQYQLGLDGSRVMAQAKLNDMLLKALVDREMNWDATFQKPLYDGMLQFKANKDGGMLNYKRSF